MATVPSRKCRKHYSYGRIWTKAIPLAVILVSFCFHLTKSSDSSNATGGTTTGNLSSGRTIYTTSLTSPSTSFVAQTSAQSSTWNCTPPAVDQFPKDVFTASQKHEGAIILHIIATVYMFVALAIACDDYFVPSLECICEIMKVTPDVAGATFMAAGSSAPELAASVIGVFVAKDDIGLSAVVGSAVFNIMFVIGICGLLAGKVVPLSWWPLVRDCAFYAISIIALVIVIYDDRVQMYEALILLSLYVVYILLMYLNGRLERWVNSVVARCRKQRTYGSDRQTIIDDEADSQSVNYSMSAPEKVVIPGDGQAVVEEQVAAAEMESDEAEAAESSKMLPTVRVQLNAGGSGDGLGTREKLAEEEETLWSPCARPPASCLSRSYWLLTYPLKLILYVTIPDCRKRKWKKLFLLTFVFSCVWIAAFSYLLVWVLTIIGYSWSIPDNVMSLIFLAAGVSVPDAIASYLVVRKGEGDMAVSNAVGSNVFDILLCLGLPWFLSTIVYNEDVIVYSSGLTYSSLTLLSTVVFLLVATHINGWKLDRRFGVILLVVYVLFLVLACLYELNVFGNFHPPTCLSRLEF